MFFKKKNQQSIHETEVLKPNDAFKNLQHTSVVGNKTKMAKDVFFNLGPRCMWTLLKHFGGGHYSCWASSQESKNVIHNKAKTS